MEHTEKMSDFFTVRVDGYDVHMLNNVEGCKEGYIKMAQLVSKDTKKLLDLGCGTGLELDEIFKTLPNVEVMGIDLTKAMLEKLIEKYPEKKIVPVCADYFKYDFGKGMFDCAVSFQTMHHFPHEKKVTLYKKIYESLTENGAYIECDYMVESQAEEDFFFAENERIRKEQGISDDEFYHFDTPCTIENQINMLKKAGFEEVKNVFRQGNTTMIVARRHKVMNKDWFFKGDDFICDVRTVAVMIKGNKILVQRDKDGTEYALPGGHIKIGETLEEGLFRELKEEIGIETECKKLLWTEECFFEWNGRKTHNLAYYFLTEIKEGFSIFESEDFFSQKDNCNVVLGWMPIEDLKNVTIYPQFLKDEIYKLNEGIKHFVSKC